MSDLIKKWRIREGLDYNGWLKFIVKRWLIQHRFGFLVPFDMRMEWRNSSFVTLDIWEWGSWREEQIRFPDRLEAGDIPAKLRGAGMTNSHDKYLVLLALGKKVNAQHTKRG